MSNHDIIYQSKGALIAFLKGEGFQTGSGGVEVRGTPSNNQVAVWRDSLGIEGDSNFTFDGTELTLGSAIDLDVGKDLQVRGNTTLGNASGDSVTINALTIDLANVAEGTDNTVLVYNGSSIVTDEIDSKVWAGDLVDYTGTPANNQLAIWTDTDTLEGSSNLTFDGTDLTVGGDLTVTGNDIKGSGGTAITMDGSNNVTLQNYATVEQALRINGNTIRNSSATDVITFAGGYVSLPTGLSSSLGTQISSTFNRAAGYWIKVAETAPSATNQRGSATIDVMLAGYEPSAELYQARVYLSYYAGTDIAICQVDIIQDAGTESWDTSDFILTYDASNDTAQLWVRDPAQYQRCYATITNGSSNGNMNYKSDWYLKTGQSWVSSYVSLGAAATTINAKKRFDSLGIDGDLQVTGSLTSDSVEVITSNTGLTHDRALFVQNTADNCNIMVDAAASKDPNIILSENTTVKWSMGNDCTTDSLRFRDDGWNSRAELTQAGDLQIDGDLTVSTAGSTIAQEAWTAPSYAGSWANYGGDYIDGGYMKDSVGFVHLRGLIKTTGAGKTTFTLPAGYQPSARLIFTVQAYDYGVGYVHGRVDVAADGAVTVEFPTPASGDWVSLNGITFDTQ